MHWYSEEDVWNQIQKNIIKCILEQVKNAKEKSKIVELIYKYRYYSLLPLEKNKILIQDDELRKTLRKLGQSICDKAEESKVIIKITTDLTKKYKIIEKLFCDTTLVFITFKLLIFNFSIVILPLFLIVNVELDNISPLPLL